MIEKTIPSLYAIGVLNLSSSSPSEQTSTKITGRADVGYVKDNKSLPANQKVKAITASIPAVDSGGNSMIYGTAAISSNNSKAEEYLDPEVS